MLLRPNSRGFLILSAGFVFAVIIQFSSLRSNPPGFFIDESSIAYNAHTIATTGKDEYGESWPLFFRAFGEYKNPVYVYLLAIVFRVTGPGIVSARALSAFAGLLTVVLLGLLATRISKNQSVGLVFAVFALLTPWLFELSRLVMEVALYPLAVALFLLAVWEASNREAWRITHICALAGTLALLTYTYSIGRLLGPVLALGLLFFFKRVRFRGILLTWMAYFITLTPLYIFNQHHPSALFNRFKFVSYVTPESTWGQITSEFLKHYFSDLNPWRLFVTESSKVSEIIHVPGPPAMLAVTAALIIASLFLLVRRRGLNVWWLFVGYGTLASVIPAALTVDDFHMLRLAALPVFLLVLTVPAFNWLMSLSEGRRRVALLVTVLLILIQGLFFQWRYHASASSPERLHTFDADYPAKILPTALATAKGQPVYLADNSARPAYIQAYWYATLQGLPLNKFVNLGNDKSPPEGAVVITTEERCRHCQILAESEPYTTYLALSPPPNLQPIPDRSMTAELDVQSPPVRLRPGQQTTLEVSVKNLGATVWLAGDRSGSPFRVSVGNHWLDPNGNSIVNDDGRASLVNDLHAGGVIRVSLVINAPRRPGEYLLEIDLLQEGVSWFGLKGSKTWRGRVAVSDP